MVFAEAGPSTVMLSDSTPSSSRPFPFHEPPFESGARGVVLPSARVDDGRVCTTAGQPTRSRAIESTRLKSVLGCEIKALGRGGWRASTATRWRSPLHGGLTEEVGEALAARQPSGEAN